MPMTLPPHITINIGTSQPAGVVAHCHAPDCEWAWIWEPQTADGVTPEDILPIVEQHAATHQQHC